MGVNSDTLAIVVLFDSLEHSRAFLVEYLNHECLFSFRAAVEGKDSFPSFICSYLTYVLCASRNMNDVQELAL
jgi:hypothetical protein